MNSKQVAIVVDSAIELPPQRLQELEILVVPRNAKIGWRRKGLSANYTGHSLAQDNPKPRRIILSTPSREAFRDIYYHALAQAPHVLSIHVPTALDEAAAQARLARNLLSGGKVTIFEPPLLGISMAKLIEVAAEVAKDGWTRSDIINLFHNLLLYTRSLFIGSPSKMLKGHLPPGFGIPQSKGLLALSIEPSTGYFWPAEQGRAPAELADWLREAIQTIPRPTVQAAEQGPYLTLIINQVGVKAMLPDLGSQLAEMRSVQEQHLESNWSPTVSTCLGEHYIQISCFPTSEVLTSLIKLTKRLRDFEKVTSGIGLANTDWKPIADRV